MKPMKILALVIILFGIGCLSYGGWQWASGRYERHQAMKQAKALVSSLHSETAPHHVEAAEPKKDQPGDAIGILDIPALDLQLPIVEGTTRAQLKKGVGHYTSTGYAGQHKQILLSGHNNTVFQKLGELKKGDPLIVKKSYGTFRYTVTRTEIVQADDQTVIHKTAPKEVLTLSTCYPFSYLGFTSKRYIVFASRVEEKAA